MSETAEPATPAQVEEEVRRLWEKYHLPSADGNLGQATGAAMRQLVGTYTPGDPPLFVAQRAVAADVDARAAMLAGDRVVGTLRREGWAPDAGDPVVTPLLHALGVWTGGSAGRTFDADDRTPGVQRITTRLARDGILIAREGPVRLCPACAAPRSPERVVYHEEVGDTHLVRFPLEPAPDGSTVEALAWVDAPWRLLGATALLVNPDLSYATVEYRRGDATARLLILRTALPRLKSWLPGVELKVVEEHPGTAYVGRRYVYPLRHEFPDGASLPAPSGTVQAVGEVGDSGTGVVPLVPGHGGTDAQIAERLGVVGWPLLTSRGSFDLTLMHKYAGLDLETASEFVARDLTESGSVLARLRVLRGVPYCGVCGRPLVWYPGKYWCLEPGRLPPEQLGRYAALLPDARPISQLEVTPWPVSEGVATETAGAVTLRECDRCSRLDAPDASEKCPCGGKRTAVARRLVPSVAGAFASWARNEPVSAGDSVRLYTGERRRIPTVVHQLAAMAAVQATGAEVRATVLPTLSDLDLPGLVREHGADAVRSALVRTASSEGPGGTFIERCRQEHRRLGRLLGLADVVAAELAKGGSGFSDLPVDPTDRDLQAEDRAILARWGQTELQVIAAYEEFRPEEAHRRLARFVELDFARYREIVAVRLVASAPVPLRRAAGRTLATVLHGVVVALAPVAPFTAEAAAHRISPVPPCLFAATPFDVEHPTPNEELARAWDRWLAVVKAVDRFRASRHLPAGTPIPSVAILLNDDGLADQLRGDRALLERLCGVGRLEIGSPRTPWEGRKRELVPVEAEIQKAYPTLAAQIIHLIRRMPSRRLTGAELTKGISVFLQGQPHQITPSMLTFAETLPEHVVPTPFALGEMFAELPGGTSSGAAEAGLPLSADGAWLVRRLKHRLRSLGADDVRTRSVRIVAADPLAAELRENWVALARVLGVASVTIDPPSGAGPSAPAVSGRTRLGARWAIEISGLGPDARGRFHGPSRAPPGGTRRMPIRQPRPTTDSDGTDYADAAVIHHEEELRTLGQELDQLLGAPWLGPSKVALAWEAGLASVDAFEHASFEQLQAIPGFGRPLAVEVFARTGRTPPPAPARSRRSQPAAPVPEESAPVEAPLAETAPPPVRRVLAWAPAISLPAGPAGEPPAPPPAFPGRVLEATARMPEPPSIDEPAAEPELAPSTSPPPEPTIVPGPEVPAEMTGSPAELAPLGPAEPSLPEPAVEPSPPVPSWRPATSPGPFEAAYVPEGDRPRAAAPTTPAEPSPVGIEVELSAEFLPALQPFLDATAAGHRGLAVVRELPERIRALVGPRPVAVYWLSNLVRDRTVRPGDLPGLATLLKQGVEANGITAVFLEGVEYLTRIHGSNAVAAFLKELDQTARGRDTRVWLHVTPGLLSPAELDQVVAELSLPKGIQRPDLPPDEPSPPPS